MSVNLRVLGIEDRGEDRVERFDTFDLGTKKELHLRRSEPLRSTRNAMVAWSIRKEKKVKKPDVSQNNMSPSPSFQVRPAINEAGRLDLCEGKYTSFKKGLLGHL